MRAIRIGYNDYIAYNTYGQAGGDIFIKDIQLNLATIYAIASSSAIFFVPSGARDNSKLLVMLNMGSDADYGIASNFPCSHSKMRPIGHRFCYPCLLASSATTCR